MRALLLTTGLMTLVACAPEAAGEDLFEVVGAVPDDGGEADAATRLELRLSASSDAEACTETPWASSP
ncbi:MAG: hypothetical protein H6740_25215 [Alphaproteobacteria bacterium]|nr:hypothetical protein [Alphaproteobacteria bacterium]